MTLLSQACITGASGVTCVLRIHCEVFAGSVLCVAIMTCVTTATCPTSTTCHTRSSDTILLVLRDTTEIVPTGKSSLNMSTACVVYLDWCKSAEYYMEERDVSKE